MATLTSSSTDAEVRAEFDNTASYEETSDVSLARRHVTACRIWLARHPHASARGTQSFQLNSEFVQKSLDQAREFVSDNASGNGGIIHCDFSEARQ